MDYLGRLDHGKETPDEIDALEEIIEQLQAEIKALLERLQSEELERKHHHNEVKEF